jgi:hypothetical protein
MGRRVKLRHARAIAVDPARGKVVVEQEAKRSELPFDQVC